MQMNLHENEHRFLENLNALDREVQRSKEEIIKEHFNNQSLATRTIVAVMMKATFIKTIILHPFSQNIRKSCTFAPENYWKNDQDNEK